MYTETTTPATTGPWILPILSQHLIRVVSSLCGIVVVAATAAFLSLPFAVSFLVSPKRQLWQDTIVVAASSSSPLLWSAAAQKDSGVRRK